MVGLLLGLSVAVCSVILVREVVKQFHAATIRQTIEIADRLENRLGWSLAAGRRESVSRVVRDLFANDPKVAFIEVRSEIGEVLARRVVLEDYWETYQQQDEAGQIDWNGIRESPVSINAAEYPEGLLFERAMTLASGRQGDQVGPFSKNQSTGVVLIGTVDFGYRSALHSVYATSILVSFLVVSISIPITVLLLRRVTRPLRRIARAAEEFSTGRHIKKIRIRRNDEIGHLAESFNRMAERLGRAHDQLVIANRGLEETVSRRTSQLQMVNDLLNQEVETKNEFIRTVTHDLNAPLRNIAGMAQMIRKRFGSELPDEVCNRIDRIEANVTMETAMLDDLLELSRLRSRPYKTTDINVFEVLNEIREALETEMIERNLQCTIDPDFPIVHIEPRLFRQVFLNLIDNAIKYMGDREVRRVSIYPRLEDHWLIITVEDTGPGIAPEAQERVFDLFSRGSTANRDERMSEPGRGVGLASVKTVVERWGGTIELESEPGVGSRFHVRIPADFIIQNGERKDAGATVSGSSGQSDAA